MAAVCGRCLLTIERGCVTAETTSKTHRIPIKSVSSESESVSWQTTMAKREAQSERKIRRKILQTVMVHRHLELSGDERKKRAIITGIGNEIDLMLDARKIVIRCIRSGFEIVCTTLYFMSMYY